MTKNLKDRDNQFLMDDKYMREKVFSRITCMATCEGICRRVLSDIKKEFHGTPIEILKEYYRYDKNHGGNRYENIIELGELLKSLQED